MSTAATTLTPAISAPRLLPPAPQNKSNALNKNLSSDDILNKMRLPGFEGNDQVEEPISIVFVICLRWSRKTHNRGSVYSGFRFRAAFVRARASERPL